MNAQVRLISSMASKDVLAKLVPVFTKTTGIPVDVQSIGGVDAARRIREGEPFDVAVLAMAAVETLAAEGFIGADTVKPFATSRTALAVRTGAGRPASCDEASVRDLVARARSIGLSTGPSGAIMVALLQRWGIYEEAKGRIVQAPPSVPVARLMAAGEADIGFQQLSELLGHPGIDIVGTLPDSLAPLTAFAAGIRPGSRNRKSVAALVEFLLSQETATVKRQHGLEPA